MSQEFTFDEASHTYRLDGVKMTGVTTILQVIAKPMLIPWAVKMCTEHIMSNCEKSDDKWLVSEEELEEAKVAHRKKKEKAGDVGTLVHDAVEDYVKNGSIPELPENVMIMFNEFKSWYDEGNYTLVESEKKLYSEKHFYAGTVDLVIEDKEGKRFVADIKTSGGVYPEYYAQMGGYHIAYDEMGNEHPISGYIIIHIPKTGKKSEQYMFHDTDMCKEFFLNALGIYRSLNNFKF